MKKDRLKVYDDGIQLNFELSSTGSHDIDFLIKLLKHLSDNLDLKYLHLVASDGMYGIFALLEEDDITKDLYGYLNENSEEKYNLLEERSEHFGYEMYYDYILKLETFISFLEYYGRKHAGYKENDKMRWIIKIISFSLMGADKKDKLAFQLYDSGKIYIHDNVSEIHNMRVIDRKFILEKVYPLVEKFLKNNPVQGDEEVSDEK